MKEFLLNLQKKKHNMEFPKYHNIYDVLTIIYVQEYKTKYSVQIELFSFNMLKSPKCTQ